MNEKRLKMSYFKDFNMFKELKMKKMLIIILLFFAYAGTAEAGQEPFPGAFVRFKTITDTGKPVQGVKITLSTGSWHDEEFNGTETSSAKGEAVFKIPVKKRMYLDLDIKKPSGSEYAPFTVSLNVSGYGSALSLTPGSRYSYTILFLKGTSSLKGTVKDDAGKPVKGASLTLDKDRRISYTAVTDANGTFVFNKIAPGEYVIRTVQSPDNSSLIPLHNWKPWGVRRIDLKEGSVRTEDFVLSKGAVLKGRILDPSGKPLKGIKVSCSLDSATDVGKKSMYQSPGQSFAASSKTDAKGYYRLGGLTKETYVIQIAPEKGSGYETARIRGINAPEKGEANVQDIRLQKGGTAVCTVKDFNGKTVHNAYVSIARQGESGMRFTSKGLEHGKTSANGEIRFKGLTTGIYRIPVDPPKGSLMCRKVFSDIEIVSGLTLKHALNMPRGITIKGTVTGPDGTPVSGACVRLNYGTNNSVNTDKQGKYVLTGLPLPEKKPFSPSKPGVSIQPPNTHPLFLTANVPMHNPGYGKTITMNAVFKTGYAVTGKVTGPDGKPVPRCLVYVVRAKRWGLSGYGGAYTDAQGIYTIGNIRENGGLSLDVTPPSHTGLLFKRKAKGSFQSGTVNRVDITLKQGSTFKGKAVTSSGKPLIGVTIRLNDKEKRAKGFSHMTGNGFNAKTGPDGAFQIKGLGAGRFTLECRSEIPGYSSISREIRIPDKGEKSMDIVMHKASSIKGKIKSSKPSININSVRVNIKSQDGTFSRTAYVRKTGDYNVYDLVPGKYTVTVTIRGKKKQNSFPVPPAKEITIKEGESKKLDIVL
jgi:protocatechuate 3,4-dioxygenase beta subunit